MVRIIIKTLRFITRPLLFLVILGSPLLLASSLAFANDEIIIVKTLSNSKIDNIVKGIRGSCGQAFNIVELDMHGKSTRARGITEEIREKIDQKNPPKYIFTIGDPATSVVQNSITEVPVFFTMISYPKEKGFFGNNIGGISLNIPIETQLEQLKTIIPIIKRVGVVHSPANRVFFTDAQTRATYMGVELVSFDVSSSSSHNLSETIIKTGAKIQALIFFPDASVINKDSYESIIRTTIENKIPTLVYSDFLVESGFLFSLEPDFLSLGQQAGQILCREPKFIGAIVAPNSAKLSINTKTAEQIGINISDDIISNATVHE